MSERTQVDRWEDDGGKAMSMERCNDCGNPIDTDFDVECYVEVGNMRSQTYEIVLCKGCRMQREDYDAQQEAMDRS